VVEVVA
jgi:hypothetical protein